MRLEHLPFIILYLSGIAFICLLSIGIMHYFRKKHLETMQKPTINTSSDTQIGNSSILKHAIPQQAIDFIKQQEGFRATVYTDIAGIRTIGYGETNFPLSVTAISEDDATNMLILELTRLKTEIQPLLLIPPTDNQLSALLSFCYNVGINAFKDSTLRKSINNNTDSRTIMNDFIMWKFAGHKLSIDLYKRRILEAKLYLE